ncbi:hypothetical protein E2C01_014132 [Portunus trituberculatus]|uniref:Uncharacterized protein n=1 Tax=Portunus trituberculatus TaxID=210409 RepID=A0A5B7DIZ3_PORTR|nr:hypothetical protein [Portunus trituberculatus]
MTCKSRCRRRDSVKKRASSAKGSLLPLSTLPSESNLFIGHCWGGSVRVMAGPLHLTHVFSVTASPLALRNDHLKSVWKRDTRKA